MPRLASWSAPLSAVYDSDASAGASAGRGAAAGAADDQQQQQQQADEDEQKEVIKQTQEKVAGVDAKALSGTQVSDELQWVVSWNLSVVTAIARWSCYGFWCCLPVMM